MIPQRPLGSQGLMVSAQGLGTMGMTAFYGDFDRLATEETSLETIATALSLGVNTLDTAWIYQSFGAGGGQFYNEELVGKAIKRHGRDKFVICTKFGFRVGESGLVVDSSVQNIRSNLNESLTRLGTDYIDLYYQHRVDPNVPIEEVVGLLKTFVEEGKIKYIGLSECTPSELRRAHAIHPISAIQMEWSLMTRDIEAEVVPTARELGVGIVAYSPLGRGFLSKTFTSREQLDPSDFRRETPRIAGGNFDKNAETIQHFYDLAERKGCTPSQLALAWVHAQGADVMPIPGTKSPSRIIENVKAYEISLTLSSEDLQEIGASVPTVAGARYDDAFMKSTFQGRV